MVFLSRRCWQRFCLIVLVGWFVYLVCGVRADSPAGSSPDSTAITIKSIKYEDLIRQVKSQQGKVVVVDVWGPSCATCMKEFPNLVKLNQDYQKKGLACISVAVALTDKDTAESSLPFLRKVKATFPNFWLDESSDLWTAKWSTSSIPMVFVFDRQGRRVGKYGHEIDKSVDYQGEIAPLVKKLLEEKP
jgi:thiol-disulfide isomerase/thioredoxin